MTSSPVIILGMHRSGTSALTGSLEQAGLVLGEVDTASPDNRKGNRESRRLMALHDDLLERNGGSWHTPPERVQWAPVHRAMRDCYGDLFRERTHWGFKDPRTLLVLTGWLDAFPDATLVGVFRDPLSVARSLHDRNGIPVAKGLLLWLHYNRILLWHKNNTQNFTLLEFSDDAADVCMQFSAVAQQLGLNAPAMTFFDDSMRHDLPEDINNTDQIDKSLNQVRSLQSKLHAARALAQTPNP
jgi:hypothetical protein